MTEADFFVDGFLPLLDILGRDELHKPVYAVPLTYVLGQLYSPPFLVGCIAQKCTEGLLSKTTDKTSLIWFFTYICLEHEKARSCDQIKTIARFLGENGGAESLKTILGGSTVTDGAPSLADVRRPRQNFPVAVTTTIKKTFAPFTLFQRCKSFCVMLNRIFQRFHLIEWGLLRKHSF